MTSLDSQAK